MKYCHNYSSILRLISQPKVQPAIKGALNPNFLNLTMNRENFGSRNVLVQFLNLLLLKSCKSTLPLTSIPKSSLEAESLLSFENQMLQLDF